MTTTESRDGKIWPQRLTLGHLTVFGDVDRWIRGGRNRRAFVIGCVRRHARLVVREDGRVQSTYEIGRIGPETIQMIVVTTEADRSRTTLEFGFMREGMVMRMPPHLARYLHDLQMHGKHHHPVLREAYEKADEGSSYDER